MPSATRAGKWRSTSSAVTGCHACSVACKVENNVSLGATAPRIL
jgi:Fe-S-cluster-containing dehydrogenase component